MTLLVIVLGLVVLAIAIELANDWFDARIRRHRHEMQRRIEEWRRR